jgi:sec-independent protein translocase protein TatA
MLGGGLGPWELIAILAIVLVIFGGGKLAGVGKSLGQGIREFKHAVTGAEAEEKDSSKKEDSSDDKSE